MIAEEKKNSRVPRYDPKLMCPYVISALQLLELGFEFISNIKKHKKSARVLVGINLS